MKTTAEKIKVMSQWGKRVIEVRAAQRDGDERLEPWKVMTEEPIWNWYDCDYRVRPEPRRFWINEYRDRIPWKVHFAFGSLSDAKDEAMTNPSDFIGTFEVQEAET